MRRWTVVGLLLLAGFGGGVAHAASLPVGTGVLTAVRGVHPCPGTVDVTTGPDAPATSVVLTAPPACAGRTLRVAVTGADGTREGTAVAPAEGGVVVPLDGGFTPSASTAVAATVDGWHSAASWTWTPPDRPAVSCLSPDPARPCGAAITRVESRAGSYDVHVRVEDLRTGSGTRANNPVRWSVTFDLGQAVYPFVPHGVASTSAGHVHATTTCGDLPLLTVEGPAGTVFGELRRDDVRTFVVHARTDPTGDVLACQ